MARNMAETEVLCLLFLGLYWQDQPVALSAIPGPRDQWEILKEDLPWWRKIRSGGI